MASPIYNFERSCCRCGKRFEGFDKYEPRTICTACTIERAVSRAKVWRCPVKRKNQGVKR